MVYVSGFMLHSNLLYKRWSIVKERTTSSYHIALIASSNNAIETHNLDSAITRFHCDRKREVYNSVVLVVQILSLLSFLAVGTCQAIGGIEAYGTPYFFFCCEATFLA